MRKIKKTILLSLILASLIFVGYYGPGVPGYLEFRKAAKAAGGFPWQDGGVISMVLPGPNVPCIKDTPPIAPTTCNISCPLLSTLTPIGPACPGFYELDVTGQNGTLVIAVPIGFPFSGGGIIPAPGMQFMAGGMMYYQPEVIAIPGASASRIIKLANLVKKAFGWL